MAAKVKYHYFPNITGVRMYLGMYVVFCHINDVMHEIGIENIEYNNYPLFLHIGQLIMSAFFAFSGFLITHMLIQEKIQTGKINLKYFFVSRVLRIWPPYYLALFLHWFIIPNSVFDGISDQFYFHTTAVANLHGTVLTDTSYFVMCLFLLPQVALTISTVWQNFTIVGGHLWSAGTEELFYLIWAPALAVTNNLYKTIRKYFTFYYIIGFFLVLLLVFFSVIYRIGKIQLLIKILIGILYLTRLSCLFIGGFGAYLFVYKKDFIKRYFTIYTFVLLLIIMYFYMFKLIVNIPLITQEFYSILYTALILFLVKDDRKYKLLDNKLFNYLGKITYGTYVYHIMIVFMVAYYCKKYNYMNPNFMYVITIILSFGIAAISYEFMEKRIYKIRNRFLN